MEILSRTGKLADLIRAHLFIYISLFIIFSITISSFLILRFEAGYTDTQIKTLSDAVWWSAVGVSTIGIGNILPESVSGRYLTLFLMVVGVIVFSIITAKIASVFTEEEVKEDLDKDIKVLEGDINRVERDIEGEVATDDKKVEDKLEKLESRINKMEKK